MTEIPDWIQEWISKDRLVANKFRISKRYLRQSKRIQLLSSSEDVDGTSESFHYVIHSAKYGRYNVRYEGGAYHCNCPFFKHRGICSHILGVCQLTGVWPDKSSIFSTE
jgi:hypothetical protein